MGPVYINADEFMMKDGEPCNDAEELCKIMNSPEAEAKRRLEDIQKAQDWAYLVNKVVGAEGDDDGMVQ